MPFFWKPYTSDVTDFIARLKADRPAIEEDQLRGRARLWDRRVDPDDVLAQDEARVPQQPYVYQTKQR